MKSRTKGTIAFHSLDYFPEMQDGLKRLFQRGNGSAGFTPVLVTLPPSVEPEYFLDGLCDDLEQAEAMVFTGDRRWLNFRLEYTDGAEFPSFALMLECMHKHSGYRNEFAGVVRVDMTDWTAYTEDSRLADVLAFIHDYSDSVFFIASVTTDDRQTAEPLKKEFGRWIHTVFIDVSKPSTQRLTEIVADRLSSSGHTLTADALELISASVDKLAKQQHFAGMREIYSLADAMAVEASGVKRISAKQIEAFSPDGEWIAAHADREKFSMGFTGGNTNGRQ